jgi:hypothetical protein
VIKNVFTIVRKALLIVASELIGNPVGYALIGVINRLSGGRLITVFLEYPATHYYVSAMTFPSYANRARWRPRFAGIYSPAPGKWGLVLAVSSLEPDLVNPDNVDHLQGILQTVEQIKNRTGAQYISLAGILPSVLHQRNLYHSDNERNQIAEIVEQAIYETVAMAGLQGHDPVILLGGAGYIGTAVYARLQQNCRHPLVSIDTKTTRDHAQMVRQLALYNNQPVLLVNVARNKVLDLFLPQMWSQLVILNEVFPAADRSLRTKLAAKGVAYYHLAGVRGFALPKFAGPYTGAIPCCAVILENTAQLKNRLVIKSL